MKSNAQAAHHVALSANLDSTFLRSRGGSLIFHIQRPRFFWMVIGGEGIARRKVLPDAALRTFVFSAHRDSIAAGSEDLRHAPYLPRPRMFQSPAGYDRFMKTTWKPHEKHGRLTRQSDLPESVYAFPKERKEPLTDARHVRNAVARFDQVIGVSSASRELAFANIKKAADYYGVDLSETSWQDLGVKPQRHRKESARKGVRTRKRTGVRKSAAGKGAVTRKRTGVAKSASRNAAATRKRRRS